MTSNPEVKYIREEKFIPDIKATGLNKYPDLLKLLPSQPKYSLAFNIKWPVVYINAIRRVILLELPYRFLDVKTSSITSSSKRIIGLEYDIIRNLNGMEISQSDDIKDLHFEIKVENKNELPIKVTSANITLTKDSSKDYKKNIDTILTTTVPIVDELYSGEYINIPDIFVNQSTGIIDAIHSYPVMFMDWFVDDLLDGDYYNKPDLPDKLKPQHTEYTGITAKFGYLRFTKPFDVFLRAIENIKDRLLNIYSSIESKDKKVRVVTLESGIKYIIADETVTIGDIIAHKMRQLDKSSIIPDIKENGAMIELTIHISNNELILIAIQQLLKQYDSLQKECKKKIEYI